MIILLVLVNIFLAAMLFHRTGMDIYDADAIDNITELLASGGIIADKEFLTAEHESSKVYVCNISEDYNVEIAKALMGEYIEAFATPSGAEFFAEDSMLSLDEDFEIRFSANGFEAPETTNALEEAERESLMEKLSSLFSDEKYGFELISSGKKDGLLFAETVQTVSGRSIDNHTLRCWFDGDRLLYLDGKWCFLSIDESFSAHTLDSVNILFIEKSELESRRAEQEDIPDLLTVNNMSLCYCSHLSVDGSKLYIIPSWHIEWAEADSNDTYYNAVSGEKTVFEGTIVN